MGRKALWEFMDGTDMFQNVFQTGPNGFPQSEATWFALGRKACGELMREILQRADYEGFHALLKEYHPDYMPPRPVRKRKPNG